jgi:hypothetical protein
MSKQSEAKEKQGYVPKAIPQTCGNCGHFLSTKAKCAGYFGGEYIDEKNLRCGVGGFAVKKMGTCNEWIRPVKKPQEKTK